MKTRLSMKMIKMGKQPIKDKDNLKYKIIMY